MMENPLIGNIRYSKYQILRTLGCFGSLLESMQQAGGGINAEHLLKMTVEDLIIMIAPNNIYFRYEKEDLTNIEKVVKEKIY
jgi:hypothetical protein